MDLLNITSGKDSPDQQCSVLERKSLAPGRGGPSSPTGSADTAAACRSSVSFAHLNNSCQRQEGSLFRNPVSLNQVWSFPVLQINKYVQNKTNLSTTQSPTPQPRAPLSPLQTVNLAAVLPSSSVAPSRPPQFPASFPIHHLQVGKPRVQQGHVGSVPVDLCKGAGAES